MDYLRLFLRETRHPEEEETLCFDFVMGMSWHHRLMTDTNGLQIRDEVRKLLYGVFRMARVEHFFRSWVRLHSFVTPIKLNLILMGLKKASLQTKLSGIEGWSLYRRMTLEMPCMERVDKGTFLMANTLFQGRDFGLEEFICFQEILDSSRLLVRNIETMI